MRSQALETKTMPLLPLFFASMNLVAIGFALSKMGRRISLYVPLIALVAFHSFRLALELILHDWSQQGSIPSTMCWSGQNFDIATGVLALVACISFSLLFNWTCLRRWCFSCAYNFNSKTYSEIIYSTLVLNSNLS